MTKQRWLEMDYKPLEGGEVDTLYKKFEKGSMYIVQFNEEVQENEIGVVYLTKDQVKKLFE